MTPYQPQSRRPIAGLFRATARVAVDLCLRLHIHPDAISWASVVVSVAAAACFWQSAGHPILLLIAPVLCIIRLWLNMLDGMVAFASESASLRGEILNDLPDRFSDVLIFVGAAHSGLCTPFSGYWAAILALLTAYVGITGQAVGGKREYAGIMSKPWRMALLSAGSTATFVMMCSRGSIQWGALTILDWTCLLIIAGCLQTLAMRLRRIIRGIADRERSRRPESGEATADSTSPSRVPRQRVRQRSVNALPARRP